MIAQLSKLRNKSFAEVKDRSRQFVAKKLESIGLSRDLRPLDLAATRRLFASGEDLNTDEFLERFNLTRPSLLVSFDDIDSTVRILKERFGPHCEEVVEKADGICEGKFDLLGFKSLFFGATIPNWHFDPVSGKRAPNVHWSQIDEIDASETGDKKVIWELNRHQYFSILGQAYLLTSDERYAEAFVDHVRDWCKSNPPKVGVNWLSSLEIAFRSISWIWALHFFCGSKAMKDDDLLRMLGFLHLNGRHLEAFLSTFFSPNTHLTGEALGLYYLGSFLPEFPEAGRWKALGYKILIDSLDVHVLADGVYCEQSSHYQRYTTDFYLNLLALMRAQGSSVESKHIEKLDNLLEVLAHLTQPDGKTPLFGDEDGGRLHRLDLTPVDDMRSTLAIGSTLLDRGDLKFVAHGPTPELFWLLGPDGLDRYDELETSAPVNKVKTCDLGGIYCARTSWTPDSDHIVIDCGPHGFLNGGHAHADALNFMLSVNGKPLFIDSGTYVYTADIDTRDRFRSTGAHNCLTVNGVGSSVPSGPFSWKSTAASKVISVTENDEGLLFNGTHDGFLTIGVRYQREIKFGTGRTVITEQISSKRPTRFEVNLILAPAISVEIRDSAVILSDSGQVIATVESDTDTEITPEWKAEDWDVSFAYGSLTSTKRLVLYCSASGDFSIRTTIRKAPSVI